MFLLAKCFVEGLGYQGQKTRIFLQKCGLLAKCFLEAWGHGQQTTHVQEKTGCLALPPKAAGLTTVFGTDSGPDPGGNIFLNLIWALSAAESR